MQEFIMMSSTWIYRPRLKRLEAQYGLAGIGFYWKAVAQIALSGGSVHEAQLLALRGRGIKIVDIVEIIATSGLFIHDDNNDVTITPELENGLREPPPSRPRARASAPTSTPTPTRPGVRPGPIDQLIEKNRIDRAREESFDRFMQCRCPHLLEMEQPLTLDEFESLRQEFDVAAIQEVLLDMENRTDLNTRSCLATARSWLKRRQRGS